MDKVIIPALEPEGVNCVQFTPQTTLLLIRVMYKLQKILKMKITLCHAMWSTLWYLLL